MLSPVPMIGQWSWSFIVKPKKLEFRLQLLRIYANTYIRKKLDQGALGMSDLCGTIQLDLKPNSVPGLTVPFPTFTFVLIDLLSLVKW